MHITIMQTEN